ncbi:hypothetical protein BDW02DRAFT_64433 [Decorospora gaudefroyi]|uniref:GRAM domain-containing protein n=1 Tax=Decorospora gaudefroyi TaxID=184978 RepID=A0A6A5K9S0_9PLEO|nr:hypothetical protein BDW02DRAFT_64433 [Decorospora gaudefroyi]
MDLKDELRQVNPMHIGLERSRITPEGQIVLPNTNAENNEGDVAHQRDAAKYTEPDIQSSTHHAVNSLRQKKHDAGVKLRKTFHIAKRSDAEKPDSKSPILAKASDVETSNSRLDNKSTACEKHSIQDLIHSPIDAVRSKVSNQGNQRVAANIAAKEIPHGQEVDLVNASTAVENARTEGEKEVATQNLSELLKLRQSTYVRWSLDRHVMKLRVLSQDTVVRKPRSEFERKDALEGTVIDWRAYASHLIDFYAHRYGGHYIGYGSDPPAPSKETMMPNIERLIVATSPFQEFFMNTRRVYRWEKPTETSKYLVIYIILWYYDMLLPGMLSTILYLVAARKQHSQSFDDLRAAIQHREDIHKTALSLNEFIEKQGDEKWADDLLQQIGPWLMIQLADLANLFETIRNFYEWRNPTRTAITLSIFSTAILATALTPPWLLLKTLTLCTGLTFFFLFPISVHFPQYRLLVSPARHLFWNIPTHAEWAIKFMQAEGLRVARDQEQDTDFGSYEARFGKLAGRLVVSSVAVRFVSSHRTLFLVPFECIGRLEKVDRQVVKRVPERLTGDGGKDLLVCDVRGGEFVVRDVEQRDEAFGQVVGFSRAVWQVVW